MRYVLAVLVLASVVLVSAGCEGPDPQKELTQLKKEKDMIHTEYLGYMRRQKEQIDRLKRENEELGKRGRYDNEKRVLSRELEGIAGLQERDGELVVLMTADILFDPGSAKLKASAKDVLSRLARALNDDLFRDKAIRIEGHTDSDPVKRSKKLFSDNWDLAASRANSVLDFLTSQGGLDPSKRTLYAASFGPYKPVAPNSDKAGKSRNRRVEVVVIMGR